MSDLYSFSPEDFTNLGKPLEDAPSILPNAVGNVGANGQQAGEALNLAKETGVPANVIDADLPGFKQTVGQQKASGIIQLYPAIEDYLRKDPVHAKVSNDDYPALASVANRLGFGLLTGPAAALDLFADPETKSKIWFVLKKYPEHVAQGLLELGKIPGKAVSEGLTQEEETGFGVNVSLATMGRPLRFGRPEPAPRFMSTEDFLSKAQELSRGMAWRQEIDDFIAARAGKEAKPTDQLLLPPPSRGMQETVSRTGELPSVGADPNAANAHAVQAQIDAVGLDRTVAAVEQSETLKRSPVAFEKFVESVDKDSVSIPAKVLSEILTKTPEKLAWLPNAEEKIQAGLTSGGDVEIPLGTYLANAKDMHEVLRDDVRVKLGSLTVTEATDIADKGFDVYHGSPHSFDAFSLEKIGTGEGAQSYGHGLYFAENVKVAAEYQDAFSGRVKLIGGERNDVNNPLHQAVSWVQSAGGDRLKAIEDAEAASEKSSSNVLQKTIDILKSDQVLPEVTFDRDQAHLYQARILANKEDFLDWDKKLSEQKIDFEKINEKVAPNQPALSEMTGEEVHRTLRRITGSDEATSKLLKEAGIPGLKYLDQGSRDISQFKKRIDNAKKALDDLEKNPLEDSEKQTQSVNIAKNALARAESDLKDAGEGTRNYVLFDDSLVRIRAINGNPVAQKAADVTEALIQSESAATGDVPLFASPEDAGMTKPQFELYRKRIAEQQGDVAAASIKAASKEIKRRQTSEWKTNEARERAEVVQGVEKQSDIALDIYLRTGKNSYGLAKATRAGLEKDASSAELVADIFGFKSSEDMFAKLDALDKARKDLKQTPAEYLRDRINAETDTRMEAKYGDLDENILSEARDVALADARLDVLDMEMKALMFKAGEEAQSPLAKPLTDAQIEKWVEIEFGKTLIKSAQNIKKYQRQAWQNAREAEIALLKKDYVEAGRAKERQIISFKQAQEAHQLAKEIESATKLISKYARTVDVPNVAQAYTNQIHGILEQLGEPVPYNIQPREQTLQEFSTDKNANGWEVAVSDILFDPSFKKLLKDMTVDEFRAVTGSIKSLDFNGREFEFVDVTGKKVDWTLLKADIILSLQKRDLAKVKRGKDRAAELDAMMLRPERLISDLDSRDPAGPLTNAIMKPVEASKFRENELLDKLTNQLKALRGTSAWRKSQSAKIEQDILLDPRTDAPYLMLRSDLMNVMLNFGNRSNIDKFLIPYARLNTKGPLVLEKEIRELIKREATPEDWKYVQGIWDIFKDLKVEADAMYRELSGVAPETIKAEPIDGNAGGYMPIIYDATRSGINIKRNAGYLEENYYRATTPAGYAKQRTGYQDYIQIINTHENIVGKMQQMIHDIAFRKAVLDTAKIIDDTDIQGEIVKRYGPEYRDQLQFWLKDIANVTNVNDPAVGMLNDILRRVRTNLVVQALGLNMQVILSPDMGSFISVGNLATFGRMVRSPGNLRSELELANSLSKELQQISINYDRDFREQYLKLIGARSNLDAFQMEAAKWAMSVTMSTSHIFRAITFLTEYRKARAMGILEEDAIFQADAMVRKTHGSGNKVDLPSYLKSNEGIKMLTIFQGYFNTMFNWQRESVQDWRNGDYGRIASTTVNTTLLGALFGYLLFNQEHKDENQWGRAAKSVAQQMMSYVPFGSAVAGLVFEGYDPRTPSGSIIKGIANVGADAYNSVLGKKVGNKWVAHVVNAPGYMFGLPTGQIAKWAQAAQDLHTGKQNPDGFWQWFKLSTTGQSKPTR